ncbi:DUF2243 domain-containing protein [Aquabacterium sp. J223]|uniref:DUF2243 domain-containing protein n=1 Tax=Aquabacterium sp. J223 TaxID=2898431 RepID=UPI0021AD555F|nr:DUF2243 domain-containing protein [Aquabacterium sp. J223]UUX95772.1 DUF2243 domain-containing protein [Aquabacterium sp. J223]
MTSPFNPPASPSHRSLLRAAALLGVAFGGFFDGILLHQVLQWHHLLSAVQGGRFADLRLQLLADGLFHLAMYGLAAIALAGLWRHRAALAQRLPLGPAFLIGFGAWHVADALLSHWWLGLHRVRMDSPRPLAWDLAWLAMFGLLPMAIGLAKRRRARPGAGATAWALALVTSLAALLAARPPAEGGPLTVVLRPGAAPLVLLAALEGSDTRVLWADRAGAVWLLQPGTALLTADLYRHGALLVAGGSVPAGCAAWWSNGARRTVAGRPPA